MVPAHNGSIPMPLLWTSARAFLTQTPPEELHKILEASVGQESSNEQQRIPRRLFPTLLAASLNIDDNSSLDILSVRLLVKHWPKETLRLSEVLLAERDLGRFAPLWWRSADLTTKRVVLQAFLDGLGHSRMPALRTLDLRGLPSDPSFVSPNYFEPRHVNLFQRGVVSKMKGSNKFTN